MADQKKEGSLFSFGGASSNNGNATSVFGKTPSNTTGLFGTPATAASGGGSSLFGSPATSAPASQSSAPSTLFANSGTIFGGFSSGSAPGGTTGGLFSTPNKSTDSNSEQAGKINNGGGIFGNSSSTPASSASQGATTPAQSKPSGLFGNFSTTPAGPPPSGGPQTSSVFSNLSKSDSLKPGMFSGANSQPSAALTSQQASASASTAPASTVSLFGTPASTSVTQSSTQPSTSLFGGQSNQNAQSNTSKTQSGGVFSLTAQKPTAQPQPTLGGSGSVAFSTSTSAAPSTQTASPSLFGGNAGNQKLDATSTQPAATPLFGGGSALNQNATASATKTSSPATTSFFTTNSAASASNGGVATSSTSQSASQPAVSSSASTLPTSNLFGNLASGPMSLPTTTTSAPTSNMFASLGGTSTATTSESQTPLGSAAPANISGAKTNPANISTNQPQSSLSSVPQPAAHSQPNAKAEDASKAATLGTSATGPKPTPQSRLKNKSMDEIITRWASDLNKYQKEFQSQATTVAKWDRMLVENSDKIQKLYGHTLEAERATIEVERQLSAVENDQAELEYWLEHYEHQVDELMSKQIGQSDSLSGPDQERERTYKLAEKMTDRLDEMAKDLTAMVDEINDASSSLSKTNKPDDPLSQIVRVLNGHLTQLQQIDQGTAALQSKVQAAQKASRQLGTGGGRQGVGGDGADDFYRSYMGRR